MRLMHLKYPMNGILGYILLLIRLKIFMISKNIIGKNLTNQIRQALTILIIQTKTIMRFIKSTKAGKVNFFNFFIIFIFIAFNPVANSSENSESLEGNFIEIKILDKVSSKSNVLKIKIGEEKKFKNLLIKSLKCKNSEFDDNPEITAYLQVKDLTNKNNDEVFVFNGWTFSSSPTVRPFDHPVYDIWLTKCY
jgi:hypothetical protein